MKIALAGNPNSGKTTLFNELTGLTQKIGNWPGVTVEKKQGKYTADKSVDIVDLPGVYSLCPISEDEKVACAYLAKERPDAVINVIDSAYLERSLALTLQLLETGIPVILALNMQDELKMNGIELDLAAIERELGVRAVQISARRARNLDKLMQTALDVAASAANTAANTAPAAFENPGINEDERAEYRHGFIAARADAFRKKVDKSRAKNLSECIDRIVLNRWLAFPIFAVVIWLMYFVSVQSIGSLSVDAMGGLFDTLAGGVGGWLENIGAAPWVRLLVTDGIITGVGAVLSFVPQIIMLFLFITFLEGCGYMARVAVIMDMLFKKLGLSGKSFVPMVIGCGCSVPAIMSAKTIENPSERRATIMLTPFIPCSAKLPVFALIAGSLMPNNSFAAPSMYFLGIVVVILGGLFLRLCRGEFRRAKPATEVVNTPTPRRACGVGQNAVNAAVCASATSPTACVACAESTFVLELPHYRLPKFKNIALELWSKIKGFLIKAGTIILPMSMLIWFLQSFSFGFQMCDIESSMLAGIGRGIAWIFKPLGFGNWQSSIAILTGFLAKETVVTTFGVLLGGEGVELSAALTTIFTPTSAYAFMAFMLLAAPCVAAMAATHKELGSAKQTFITISFQCATAYIVALIINQLGRLWAANQTLFISILAALIATAVAAVGITAAVRRKRAGACAGCSGCNKINE